MTDIATRKRRVLAIVAVAAFAMSAAGCSLPDEGLTDNYAVNHPITVGQEDVRMALPLPLEPNSMSDENAARLTRFLNTYVSRGRGRIVIEAVGSMQGDEVGQNLRAMQKALLAAGMRENEVAILPGVSGGGKPFVQMSYTAYAVSVPECGDWSVGASETPRNTVSSNFGCSYQRNLGLMIDNPKDLVQARAVTPRDIERATAVIVNYRNQAATVSPKSPELIDFDTWTQAQ